MKFIFIIIVLDFAIRYTNSHREDTIQFIKGYFENKNTTITLNVCWDKYVIKIFLKEIMSDKPKQVAFYRTVEDFQNFNRNKLIDNFYVVDLNNCSRSWLFLQHINQTDQFKHATNFLLLTEEIEQLSAQLANYTIYPRSELILAKMSESKFKLYQPYRIDKSSPIIWENYGVWTKKYGLIENFLGKPTSGRRHDLKQANMGVIFVITDNDTWNHLDDFKYPRVDSLTKQVYGAIRSLLDYCNVNATYLGTEYFGYYNNDTGLWNGVVGHLISNKAQISGSSPYFLKERAVVVDFIKMQNPTEIRFILKKPPLSYMRNVFELAFQRHVWLSMGIILLIFAIALFVILNVETNQKQINHKDNFTASDVVLIVLEALCQQGTTTEPKRISGRILALILFMAFMFIYVAYSANIIVMLQSQVELQTVKELLESRIGAGALQTPYMKIYLSQHRDLTRQQLYHKKIGPNGFCSLDKGMSKVHEGFFAFHVEVGAAYDYILEKFTDYDICSLQELEGYLQHMEAYTCVRKNSPYREIFKVGLLKIAEYGIEKRNYMRYFIKPKCYSKGSSFESVGIIETYQCFFILIYGILLSVTICCMERFLHNVKNRKVTSLLKH